MKLNNSRSFCSTRVILNEILIAEWPKNLTNTTIKNAEILSDDD
jgi:hypothetical protein